MLPPVMCPECGKPAAKGLCSGVCPECLANSMLGDWDELLEDDPTPAEPVITRIADYEVLRVLGRGGMGVVCRARDRLLGREVAMKLIHSGVLASDEELRRFRLEAETVASLRHPNLIVVHEAGEADGQPYFIMTLAEGGTLAKRLLDQGPMETHAAARLVYQIANAVHHAHMRGVLHRDLKPANILFDGEERPLVSDFGLARFTSSDSVTKSGALLGTPAYLAPEVASGIASHTISSDVYALGVILFECLTGRQPFENDSPLALLKSITENEPPAPSSLVKNIDRDLEAVCLRALEKDPERRYTSADAFATDLAHWLADEPVTARHPPVIERLLRWSDRNQTRAVLYSMAALTVLILVMLSAVMNVVMSTEQSRTSEGMHRSEVRRTALLRDHAVQFLGSTRTMVQAVPFLEEAVSLTTDNALQDHGIRLRQRVVQRLSPPMLKQWKLGTVQPVLAWSPDSAIAACNDGSTLEGYDVLHNVVASADSATLAQTSPSNPIEVPSDGSVVLGTLHSPDGRSVLVRSRTSVSLYTTPTALPSWRGTGLKNAWFDSASRLVLLVNETPQFLPALAEGNEPPSATPPPPSTDSNTVVTGIEDDTVVHCWRGAVGEREICDPFVHSSPVTAVEVNPTGRYVATLTAKGELRVWELATGLPITPPLPGHNSASHLLWDANRYQLAVWDETHALLYDW